MPSQIRQKKQSESSLSLFGAEAISSQTTARSQAVDECQNRESLENHPSQSRRRRARVVAVQENSEPNRGQSHEQAHRVSPMPTRSYPQFALDNRQKGHQVASVR